MAFRHEAKYFISNVEYELISRKLALTMDRDQFALESGKYFIRSLYFDDYGDSAYYQKLSGNDDRDKYRIRIYNMRDDVIKLERKHKQGPYVKKDSLSLTRAECDSLINGQSRFLLKRNDPFAHEMHVNFVTMRLKPRVLVDYWREAYVFAHEDVRVTFDLDVRTALRCTRLFDGSVPTYPVAAEFGNVMEVKFNRYFQYYVRTLVQPIENAQRDAISKYCMCRRYE